MRYLRFLTLVVFLFSSVAFSKEIKIGSKRFPESYILSEIIAQLLEANEIKVSRHFGLGGTLVAYKALQEGEVNLYPEYTGTIEETILKEGRTKNLKQMNKKLSDEGVEFIAPFGFNNTYALAVTSKHADKINNISDLRNYKLRAVMDFEFLDRSDGWREMQKFYNLDMKPKGLDHNLCYQALNNGKADLSVVYVTDAFIDKYNLKLLKDDKNYFPKYIAGILVSKELPDKVRTILKKLENKISEEKMRELIGQAEIEHKTFGQVASGFLISQGLMTQGQFQETTKLQLLMSRVGRHLYLTFVAILLAVLVAIPLAVGLLKVPAVANIAIIVAGLMQTIPSIALLAFMIPFFGIGTRPAIVGLFIYSILPILRNTYVSLKNIDPVLIEVSRGIGFYNWESLVYVKLPLAMPVILSGIRTAAVINIGTATLAAFIGAGGLGEPIVTGLSLNNTSLILEGAIPAAVLAITIELLFEFIEKRIRTV